MENYDVLNGSQPAGCAHSATVCIVAAPLASARAVKSERCKAPQAKTRKTAITLFVWRQVDRTSKIMQRTKKSQTGVHQMIELVNALSEAESFEKVHEVEISTVQNVMDWTELCAIGDHSSFLSLLRDFDQMQAKIHDMLERKDHGQNIVAQERDKVMGYLALETENVRKETLALSRQLYDETYGPLTDAAVAETAGPNLKQLTTQLSALVERWTHVQEAEHAMQLASSQNKLLFKMESDSFSYAALFSLHFEASRRLAVELAQPIAEIYLKIDDLLQVQSKLWEKVLGLDQVVFKSVVFTNLKERLQRLEQNLLVLKQVDTSAMQYYHWQAVLEHSTEAQRVEVERTQSSKDLLSLEDDDRFLETPDSSGPVMHHHQKFAIEQVMKHDLTEKGTRITLERMSILASHETTVRALLQRLEFQWRGEEWVFKGHVTSSGVHVYMMDFNWAAHTGVHVEST